MRVYIFLNVCETSNVMKQTILLFKSTHIIVVFPQKTFIIALELVPKQGTRKKIGQKHKNMSNIRALPRFLKTTTQQ